MDKPPRYTLAAIAIHWLTAILVVALFALGWYMVDLPKGPARARMFALHKSLGLTVLWLLGLRLVWRRGHPPPALPASMARWQRRLAHGVQHLLYVLLAMQPLSGYLSSSFSGHDTAYFGLPLPSWGHHDARLNAFFTEVHAACAIALLAAVAVHLAGALSHARVGGENVLRRMRPW